VTGREDGKPCVPYQDRGGDWTPVVDAEVEIDAVRSDVCALYGEAFKALVTYHKWLKPLVDQLLEAAAQRMADK
jgi:hypothetical protein